MMQEPENFIKRPVTIQAMRLDHGNWQAVVKWMVDNRCYPTYHSVGERLASFTINTLAGAMDVPIGDWVIRGVEGEFYPCAHGIFEQTYDPA